VNAVKHGNKNDLTKLVKITAELSPKEASFTVEMKAKASTFVRFRIRAIPRTVSNLRPWSAPHLQHHGRS
jgi:hypothetical protein